MPANVVLDKMTENVEEIPAVVEVVIPKLLVETSSTDELVVALTESCEVVIVKQVSQNVRVPRNKRYVGFTRLNNIEQATISLFLIYRNGM